MSDIIKRWRAVIAKLFISVFEEDHNSQPGTIRTSIYESYFRNKSFAWETNRSNAVFWGHNKCKFRESDQRFRLNCSGNVKSQETVKDRRVFQSG